MNSMNLRDSRFFRPHGTFAAALLLLSIGSIAEASSYKNSNVTSISLTTYDATNTLDGSAYSVTNYGEATYGSSTTEVYVGNSSSNSNNYVTLLIENGGALTSSNFYLGYGNTGTASVGSHNIVTVGADSTTGDTSTLAVNDVTYIGYYGSSNTLTIQSGADVTGEGAAYIGEGDASASTSSRIGYNNTVTVMGTGSTWILRNGGGACQQLHIGEYGCSNELEISDGGEVTCGALYIGYGDESNSDAGCDNSVTLTGTGSSDTSTTLNVNGGISIGTVGSSNALTIQSGADVTSTGDA